MIHGILVAVGVAWIFKIIPDAPDEVPNIVMPRGNPASGDKQKPSKPSHRSDLARSAAMGATSPIILPDPEMSSEMVSLGGMAAGSLGGLASGDGERLSKDSLIACGPGERGPGHLFFDTPIRAQRLVYVIDFSQSMRADGRDTLMRDELSKSVKALPDKTKYQLIFFSGPAWVAGDDVTSNGVVHKGKEYRWTSKSLWEWAPVGPMMKVDWEDSTDAQRRKSIQIIKDTPLVGGTDWETPLKMAMAMEPPPEQIFFMTDGAMENRDMDRLVRGLVATAKSRNIRINTVNMMVPQKEAVQAMSDLATKTGGKFTIVEKDGKVRKGTR